MVIRLNLIAGADPGIGGGGQFEFLQVSGKGLI